MRKFSKPLGRYSQKQDDFSQTEFANEKKDNNAIVATPVLATKQPPEQYFKTLKQYRYKPPKFSAEYGSKGLKAAARYFHQPLQPYGGGASPITTQLGHSLNGLIRLGTVELLEDQRISSGFGSPPTSKDNGSGSH